MSDLDFRPRFRIVSNLSFEDAEQLLLLHLRKHNPGDLRSAIVKGHIVLCMPPQKQHFWSPQMDISIAQAEEDDPAYPATVIRCLTAPAPAVWTMFMFFYGFAGFTVLVGLMIASSQYTLGYDLWGLYIALGGAVLGLGLFMLAQTGKRLAKEDMKGMKNFVDGVFQIEYRESRTAQK